ncbi:hypothetical protein HA402_003937 [Bradysia odoriphaga]|nr:hypothetical protein HA402_003937 [Bradysia odoriphaga]
MTAQQRGPFEKQAKESKCGPRREAEKYTSQGIALSVIEREQKKLEQDNRTMMRTIQNTVVDAFTNNTIASQEFIFISGNYFINIDEHYLPAEIAMVRFSLEHGIVSKFHTYVDPEKVPLGYLFDAKDNSEKTHRLPIPPHSKGERNYKRILDQMKMFMGEPMPILFTSKENIAMIKSFIQSFIDFGNNGDIESYREVEQGKFEFVRRWADSIPNIHVVDNVSEGGAVGGEDSNITAIDMGKAISDTIPEWITNPSSLKPFVLRIPELQHPFAHLLGPTTSTNTQLATSQGATNQRNVNYDFPDPPVSDQNGGAMTMPSNNVNGGGQVFIGTQSQSPGTVYATSGQLLTANQNVITAVSQSTLIGANLQPSFGTSVIPSASINRSQQQSATTLLTSASQTPFIAASQSQQLGASQTPFIAASQSQQLGASQTPFIAASQSQQLGASQTPFIAASQSQQLGASQMPFIAASQSQKLGASQTQFIAASQSQQLGASQMPFITSSQSQPLGASQFPFTATSQTRTLGANQSQFMAAGQPHLFSANHTQMLNTHQNPLINQSAYLGQANNIKNSLPDQSTKRQEDAVSIRTGTSCKSQTSRVRSVSSKASKTSSQRLRDVELQKVQAEYELEKEIDEERLALERKALTLKEIREKKLLEAKYRAMEEIVSVHSAANSINVPSKKSDVKSEKSLRSSMINKWIEKQIEMVQSKKSIKPLDMLPTELDTTNANFGQSINVSIPKIAIATTLVNTTNRRHFIKTFIEKVNRKWSQSRRLTVTPVVMCHITKTNSLTIDRWETTPESA